MCIRDRDQDEDEWTVEQGDCDDTDANTYPGAVEICDQKDNDCNVLIDDGLTRQDYYPDGDGDGYGIESETVTSCAAPAGYADNAADCDDTNSDVYPGAPEIYSDGIDQDCNGNDPAHIDLNQDGWPDIIMANHYNSSSGYSVNSTIYWGTSSGPTASNYRNLPTLGALGVCVNDLNLDGYQDVVFANVYNGSSYNTSSYIYWGQPGGPTTSNYTALPTYGAQDCAIGDTNADGWPDLAFSGYYNSSSGYASSTMVYYGSSIGFSSSSSVALASNGNQRVMFNDVNGDGYLDLLQPNHYNNGNGGNYNQNSNIFWGSGSGLSASNKTALATIGAWARPAVADLNGDGYKEVVFANYYNGSTYNVNSYIYWGSASGFVSKTELSTPGGGGVIARDLDLDGHIDLFFLSNYDGDSSTDSPIYWGSASGFSSSDTMLLPGYQPARFAVADVNQDGYPDIALANYSDGSSNNIYSYIYLGGATGYSSSRRYSVPTNGAIGVDLFDVDRDGYGDAVFTGYHNGSTYDTNGYVYYWTGSGYATNVFTSLPTHGGQATLVAGDPW